MDNPLVQPDPGLAIWTIITFLVLLWGLAKIGWRPLLSALEARQERIRKSLEEAQQATRELEELTRQSAQILKKAHAEAESILAKGRAEAEILREEMKQKARTESEGIIREARNQIEAETNRALRSIRSEIADLSVHIASKLIQRSFTREDDLKLIEETLNQIDAGSLPS
jgi:F-type H+-transporting ATPase subunit b